MRSTLFLLFLPHLICNGFLFNTEQMSSDNTIEPGDSLVFIGETLIIKCQAETASPNQLFFSFSVDPDRYWEMTHESSNVTIMGNTIEAHVFVDDSFPHTTNVRCEHREEDVGWLIFKIYAEKPLKNVSDFEGFYQDYDNKPQDKSVFSWSNNTEDYLNPNFIRIQVNYSRGGLPQHWSDTDAAQTWDGENCEVDYYGEDTIYLLITVSHTKEMKRPNATYLQPLYPLKAEAQFLFNLTANRKTGRVTDVRMTERLPTCIKLVYDLPSYFRTSCPENCKRLHYQVDLTSKSQPELNIVIEDTQLNEESIAPVEVCNLAAFTDYAVTVKVKDKPENPWSDPSVSIDVITEEDNPLHGPVVTKTSYSVVASCVDNIRTVYVYWNPQSVSSLRGVIQGYNVSIGDSDSRKLRTGINYDDREVTCDQSTDFEIYSLNNAGQSLSPSVVHVPPQNIELDLLPTSDFDFRVEMVTMNDTNKFVIRWNADALQCDRDLKLYLYMCEESDPKTTCFSDYQVQVVTACETHNLTVENLERNIDLIGYAVEDSMGHTTGIQWTECIYQNRKPPSPSNLRAIPSEEPGTLEVLWSGQRCNKYERVLIKLFNITLCSAKSDVRSRHAGCQNILLQSDKGNSYVFRGLEEGHTYQVSLIAQTPSDQSDPAVVEGSTKEPEEEGGVDVTKTVGIVMGAIIGISTVACVVVCCIWYRRKSKAMKANNETLKELMESEDRQATLEKQMSKISSDSGINSSTPDTSPPPLPERGPNRTPELTPQVSPMWENSGVTMVSFVNTNEDTVQSTSNLISAETSGGSIVQEPVELSQSPPKSDGSSDTDTSQTTRGNTSNEQSGEENFYSQFVASQSLGQCSGDQPHSQCWNTLDTKMVNLQSDSESSAQVVASRSLGQFSGDQPRSQCWNTSDTEMVNLPTDSESSARAADESSDENSSGSTATVGDGYSFFPESKTLAPVILGRNSSQDYSRVGPV